MSYEFYKILHLLGLFLLFLSFGAALLRSQLQEVSFKKNISTLHGIALALILIAGFGLLAKRGIHWPWPGWVWVKLVVWIMFGGVIACIHRALLASQWMILILLVLGGLGAYMALYKPF